MSDGFWICTEPTIDGKTYVVTLSMSEDLAFTLTPIRASAYATALLAAVADAEYDHAIFRQITEKVGMAEELAFQLVRDVRNERPQREAAGLKFIPGVSARKRHPFVQVTSNNQEVGQFDTDSARRHALHVLEAVPAADLDAAYLKVLRATIGLDENRARQIVENVGEFREPWKVADR